MERLTGLRKTQTRPVKHDDGKPRVESMVGIMKRLMEDRLAILGEIKRPMLDSERYQSYRSENRRENISQTPSALSEIGRRRRLLNAYQLLERLFQLKGKTFSMFLLHPALPNPMIFPVPGISRKI